ncbi:hypothetical protein [Microbispora sp. NPDC046933]|uniref:hypothetical protein n=1 Tax=Microbispora sp. NPDC046933 TaxID=3155618 RepID=UPI0033E7A0CC
MPVLERGEPGDILVLDVVALRAQLGDGRVSEYEALSVATSSGFTPPSRFSRVSSV